MGHVAPDTSRPGLPASSYVTPTDFRRITVIVGKQQQLLFDFDRKRDPATESAGDFTPPAPAVADVSSDATLPPLILAWDFRVSFPQPLDSAIEAGKLHEDDVLPANLKSLHGEFERECLSLLSDLDTFCDARRRGIDPATGKRPRTEKRRIALEKQFTEEPTRLQHGFDVMMDAYGEGFGDEAAQEFRKAIVARHHGIDVLSDAPPPPSPPLESSVQAGVFGHEEDGTNVSPSREEIDEITEDLADRLRDLPNDSPHRAELFKQYVDDFGKEAAAMLDEWLRREAKREETSCNDAYAPGHPWHYYHKGDAADPIPTGEIPAADIKPEQLGVKLSKEVEKRHAKLRSMLEDARRQLQEDERRYDELIEKGVDALSDYDKNIAYSGNDELAWASAIALKYNHIRFAKGRIALLDGLARR